jgi:hypothetical protein
MFVFRCDGCRALFPPASYPGPQGILHHNLPRQGASNSPPANSSDVRFAFCVRHPPPPPPPRFRETLPCKLRWVVNFLKSINETVTQIQFNKMDRTGKTCILYSTQVQVFKIHRSSNLAGTGSMETIIFGIVGHFCSSRSGSRIANPDPDADSGILLNPDPQNW